MSNFKVFFSLHPTSHIYLDALSLYCHLAFLSLFSPLPHCAVSCSTSRTSRGSHLLHSAWKPSHFFTAVKCAKVLLITSYYIIVLLQEESCSIQASPEYWSQGSVNGKIILCTQFTMQHTARLNEAIHSTGSFVSAFIYHTVVVTPLLRDISLNLFTK